MTNRRPVERHAVTATVVLFGMLSLCIAATAGAQGFVLDEIITKARKRDENLQNTPVAVSTFTQNELQVRQIDSTDRLGDITPNLTFDSVSPSSGSSSAAQIFIRGVGQTDFTPVTDPGVGLYIDGIYMARSVGNVLDFLDVDRIEILRGPQGTLFGRNTIGGAVVINSQRPTDEFFGSAELQVGDDAMVYATGKVNIPLSDNVAASLAGQVRQRDGYVKRVFDGVETGDEDSTSVRGALTWNISDNVSTFFTADYTSIDENGAPTVSGGVNDAQAFGTFGNGLLDSCAAIVINNGGFGPPPFGAGGPPSLPPPGAGAGGAPGCFGPDAFAGEYTSQGTFPVKSELNLWGVSAEVVWEVADWLEIKSITGYREMEMESSRDGDNTPANIFATQDFYDHEQISTELQFAGAALDDALDWLVGLYYFQEEGFNFNPVTLPVGALRSGGFYDNDSFAIFGQATYTIAEKVGLTFGIRRTEDTKRYTPDQFALGDASATGVFNPTWDNFVGLYLQPAPGAPLAAGDRILPRVESERDFDDTNVLLNVSYQVLDDLLLYATYSEGFKSGGFDQRFAGQPPAGAPNAPSSFEPETVESIEVGIKTEFLDNRVRLNAAYFISDYQDLQIIIRETFNPITFNGGSADIDGGELELTVVPIDELYITASVGYIDAEYDQLSSQVLNNATPVLPGFSLVNTPKWSSAVGVAYAVDVGAWGTVTPRVDWSYHDDQFNDAVNTPQLFQDNYNLWNAAVTWVSTDEQWEGKLAFRNITDEEYLITGNSAFATSASYVEQVYGRPFEWSLALKYNFR